MSTPVSRNFPEGEIIFNECDASDGLYIVKRGEVSIFRRMQVEGREADIELTRIHPGGIFGEMSIVDLGGRSASARTAKECELVFISAESLQEGLKQLPPWAHTLLKTIITRLREMNQQLVSQVASQVRAIKAHGIEKEHLFYIDGSEDEKGFPAGTRKLLDDLGITAP